VSSTVVEDGEMRLVVVVLGGKEGEVRLMVVMGSIQLEKMVVVMLPWRMIAESEKKKKMKKKKVK
jgi:hypothetical protein